MRLNLFGIFLCAGVCTSACSGDPQPSPGDTAGTTASPTTGADTTGGSGGDAGTGGTTAATNSGGTGDAGTTGAGPTTTGATAGDAGSDGDAGSSGGDGASATTGDGGEGGPTGEPFPPVSDVAAPGPYETTTLTGAGPDGGYTIYLPTELAPGGALNPVVGWMSGGGTTHGGYALLPHLASHGFVVVAADTVPSIGAEAELGQQILDGIEWALAENEQPDSELYQKLDPNNVASAGYSMGSLATFTIADDPRLTTTLHISGGNMAPERIHNLREPAAFICGTPGDSLCNILSPGCDIAAVNCDADFEAATTPVFYANFEGGHLGILTPPLTGQINEMSTAWLRYTLMHDTSFAPRFEGADCAYCSDPAWKVQRKGLP